MRENAPVAAASFEGVEVEDGQAVQDVQVAGAVRAPGRELDVAGVVAEDQAEPRQ